MRSGLNLELRKLQSLPMKAYAPIAAFSVLVTGNMVWGWVRNLEEIMEGASSSMTVVAFCFRGVLLPSLVRYVMRIKGVACTLLKLDETLKGRVNELIQSNNWPAIGNAAQVVNVGANITAILEAPKLESTSGRSGYSATKAKLDELKSALSEAEKDQLFEDYHRKGMFADDLAQEVAANFEARVEALRCGEVQRPVDNTLRREILNFRDTFKHESMMYRFLDKYKDEQTHPRKKTQLRLDKVYSAVERMKVLSQVSVMVQKGYIKPEAATKKAIVTRYLQAYLARNSMNTLKQQACPKLVLWYAGNKPEEELVMTVSNKAEVGVTYTGKDSSAEIMLFLAGFSVLYAVFGKLYGTRNTGFIVSPNIVEFLMYMLAGIFAFRIEKKLNNPKKSLAFLSQDNSKLVQNLELLEMPSSGTKLKQR